MNEPKTTLEQLKHIVGNVDYRESMIVQLTAENAKLTKERDCLKRGLDFEMHDVAGLNSLYNASIKERDALLKRVETIRDELLWVSNNADDHNMRTRAWELLKKDSYA